MRRVALEMASPGAGALGWTADKGCSLTTASWGTGARHHGCWRPAGLSGRT